MQVRTQIATSLFEQSVSLLHKSKSPALACGAFDGYR
jgi:hypothetical protein